MALDEAAFARAVETARQHIPIVMEVVREEYRVGFTIVRQRDRYAVLSADAWDPPTTPGFLPWSPPIGEPVADVALDGTVTLREDPIVLVAGSPVDWTTREFTAAPNDCDQCLGSPVPGAIPAMNSRAGVQSCDQCRRFPDDLAAAAALAARVGGAAMYIRPPE